MLALAPASAFALLAYHLPLIASGGAVVYSVDWFSSLGASFDLKLDGLAAMMSLLVVGIGALIVIYAGGYMHGHKQLGRFYMYLLAFMGAMLGLILSDNLLLLFVFWELTSITSYLLIGFNHEEAASRWKALQALLVTGLGAMAMLVGFILIGTVTGSYQLSEINGMGDLLQGSPLYLAIVILILGGTFTKSAQVPFHFWLPNAMAAPTPVSAYLHSATMVKAGVFLMARLNPSLGGTELWGWTLAIFGSVTMLLAVGLGLFQTDLKRILAYTTLAVLGVLTMLLGLGSIGLEADIAIRAMVVFLIGHAFYKAALFMVAGSIDHETGTRDVTRLRGLRGVMPITALAAGFAALSMCGLPPFMGFLGKELVYEAGVGQQGAALYFLIAAFAGNAIMLALALSVGVAPFFGRQAAADSLPKKPHEAPVSMWFGPLVLGCGGLFLGLFPAYVGSGVVAAAVASIQGEPIHELKLTLWHGFNLPLLISVITVICGFIIFRFRRPFWERGVPFLTKLYPYGAESAYDRIFNGVVWFSKKQTRVLQTGRLHDYVFMIVATASALLIWAFLKFGGIRFSVVGEDFSLLIAGLVVLMIIATVIAVAATHYMTVLTALGTIGFGVALIFAYYSAPDLAITQLLVETLTVILFIFVIIRLPPMKVLSGKAIRWRDAVLSGTFGVLISLLVIQAVNIQFDRPISTALAEMSYPEALGRNVVNVILVDFRALDTFGEIVVIAVAALGIAAVVSAGFRKRSQKKS